MCRRTAVPLKKKKACFFCRFKAARGAEWYYREEGGGEGEGRQSGLSVFFLPGTGLCHLTPATEWAAIPCPLGRKLAPPPHRNSKGRVYANSRGQRKWVPSVSARRPDENGTCFPHRRPFKRTAVTPSQQGEGGGRPLEQLQPVAPHRQWWGWGVAVAVANQK